MSIQKEEGFGEKKRAYQTIPQAPLPMGHTFLKLQRAVHKRCIEYKRPPCVGTTLMQWSVELEFHSPPDMMQ